jgi:hypothetical protein
VSVFDPDAIRARLDTATEGPWIADDTELKVNTPDGRALVVLATVLLGDDDTRENHPQALADAEFIAHARTDVGLLLAENERLAAEADRLDAALTRTENEVHHLTPGKSPR